MSNCKTCTFWERDWSMQRQWDKPGVEHKKVNHKHGTCNRQHAPGSMIEAQLTGWAEVSSIQTSEAFGCVQWTKRPRAKPGTKAAAAALLAELET